MMVLIAFLTVLLFLLSQRSQGTEFRIGDELSQDISYTDLDHTLNGCFKDQILSQECVKEFQRARGNTLISSSQSIIEYIGVDKNILESRLIISYQIGDCAMKYGHSYKLQEYLFHIALAVSPWNPYCVKNYAYKLEWKGYLPLAESLLEQSFNLTKNLGVLLQYSFASSSILESTSTAFRDFSSIIIKTNRAIQLYQTLQLERNDCIPTTYDKYRESILPTSSFFYSPFSSSSTATFETANSNHTRYCEDPFFEITDIPLNFQYIGYSPNLLSQLYTYLVRHFFHSSLSYHLQYINSMAEVRGVDLRLSDTARVIPLSSPLSSTIPIVHQLNDHNASNNHHSSSKIIRLGIVSEHDSNSSPGLCLTTLFTKLIQMQRHNIEVNIINSNTTRSEDDGSTNANTSGSSTDKNTSAPRIELTYFGRPNAITYFASQMSKIAQKVVILNVSNPYASAELIANEHLDVLIYIALPTEKLTLILSMFRLAPVQIQYGIGHPLSSGSPEIDYSVVSLLMSHSLSVHTTPLHHSHCPASDCSSYTECSTVVPTGRGDTSDSHLLNCLLQLNTTYCQVQSNSSNSNSSSSSSSHTHKSLKCSEHRVHATLGSLASPSTTYSEQLVLFDSLGHYLDDPLSFYEDDQLLLALRRDPLHFFTVQSSPSIPSHTAAHIIAAHAAVVDADVDMESESVVVAEAAVSSLLPSAVEHSDHTATAADSPPSTAVSWQGMSCTAVNAFLTSLSLSSPLTAQSLGCEHNTKIIRLYMCIQPLKKMHPLLDEALSYILTHDSQALILVYDSAKALIDRWLHILIIPTDANSTKLETINRRFVFVPRVTHDKYLVLLSLSSVFLSGFPFGAGVTSSEALALCVPVIVLPQLTSVLQFALAQLRMLSDSTTATDGSSSQLHNFSTIATSPTSNTTTSTTVTSSTTVNSTSTSTITTSITVTSTTTTSTTVISELVDFVSLLSADNISEYGRKAVYYASDFNNANIDMRRKIFERKHRLFGESVLLKTVHEWIGFLHRIA